MNSEELYAIADAVEVALPEARAADLARRLTAPGPTATAASASEVREASDALTAAYAESGPLSRLGRHARSIADLVRACEDDLDSLPIRVTAALAAVHAVKTQPPSVCTCGRTRCTERDLARWNDELQAWQIANPGRSGAEFRPAWSESICWTMHGASCNAVKIEGPPACGCHCRGGCGDPYAACARPCAAYTPP